MGSAYEIPSLRFSAISAGTIATGRFLKLDSAEKALHATLGDAAIGVSIGSASTGEIIDIADGIVIVESGAAVAVGSPVQSDALGKAITRTTGYILGVAMTASAGAGQYIAVKTPAISTTSNLVIMPYIVATLAAGVDLADQPMFAVPTGKKFTIISAQILSQGTAVGVDDTNTCVVTLEEGVNKIAEKTFDTDTAFPAAGVSVDLGAITNGVLAAGKVVTVSVTNEANANPPAFVAQVVGILEDA